MKKFILIILAFMSYSTYARDFELTSGESIIIGDHYVSCEGSSTTTPDPVDQLKKVEVRFYSGMCAIFGKPTSSRVIFEASSSDECINLVGSMSDKEIRRTDYMEIDTSCHRLSPASPYLRQQLVNKCIDVINKRR